MVSFGTYTETIPAGSFVRRGSGFAFEYRSDGPGITRATITVGHLAFRADTSRISGVDLSDTANPVDILVRIGDDEGTALVRLHGPLAAPNTIVTKGR